MYFVITVRSDSGFYFPDQISSKAYSRGEASVNGNENAHSDSQGQAILQNYNGGGSALTNTHNDAHLHGNTGFNGNTHGQPPRPDFGHGHGQGYGQPAGGYQNQGYAPNYQQDGPGYIN